MIKVKFDCPIDFFNQKEFENLLTSYKMVVNEKEPEYIVVNPGANFFLDSSYFEPYKKLKGVGTPSTGINHINTDYLSKKGIKLFCLLDSRETLENIHASAEFTWLHIMNAFRKFTRAIQNVNDWREKDNESLLRSHELAEKKIGIIGLGRIGRKIAKYAEAFSMNVFFYDPYVINEKYRKVNNISDFYTCDVVSINCYLTEETRNLITYDVFNGFKKDLIVVNTSRGEVVDEDYIYHLLEGEKIIYSCDVLKNEQNYDSLKKSKLFNLKSDRLTITPHVAGATAESQLKALSAILKLFSQN